MFYLVNLLYPCIFITQAIGQTMDEDFVDVSKFGEGCGTLESHGPEVHGGQLSQAGQFPWVVKLSG